MTKKNDNTSGPVYSTEHGRMCPACGYPAAACSCRQRRAPTKGDGIVRISLETKGRKGKGMTCVTGLPLDEDELRHLASQLKQRCGSGGTVKEGIIEIQGDHRHTLAEELTKKGYRVKQAGG
ncbi:MAG: translation initiation factor Sui1 [Deltaproteobacteria bacterium]|nr:translation initiation factor Sui1 [Deltaproteobacteria bacterium]